MPTIRKWNNSYQITVCCGYDIKGKQIRRTKPPRVEQKEPKYLDEVQAATLLNLLENESTEYMPMLLNQQMKLPPKLLKIF